MNTNNCKQKTFTLKLGRNKKKNRFPGRFEIHQEFNKAIMNKVTIKLFYQFVFKMCCNH